MPTENIAIEIDCLKDILDVLGHLGCVSFEEPANAPHEKSISRKSARMRWEHPDLFAFLSSLSNFILLIEVFELG